MQIAVPAALVLIGGAVLVTLALETTEALPVNALPQGTPGPTPAQPRWQAAAQAAPDGAGQPQPPGAVTLERWAADGLPIGTAAAIANRVDERTVAGWLADHSHMDAGWLAQHGMGPAAQRQLLALALAQGETPATREVDGQLKVTSQSQATVASDAALLTTERSLFAGFALPADYSADAVVVRWVDLDARTVASVDRHPLSADSQARQEVWMRPAQDWRAGRYRVEVFAADASLRPLAAGNYTISIE